MKIERFAEGISLKRSVEAGTADQEKRFRILFMMSGNAETRLYIPIPNVSMVSVRRIACIGAGNGRSDSGIDC